MSFVRAHKGAVVYSVALHVALVAALTLGFHLPASQRAAIMPAPIQGVIVDEAVLEQHERAVREEQQRQQREERQKREAVQRAQRERDEAAKREQERVAQEKLAKERAEQQERERVAAQKREQERKAQEDRDRQAREKQQREEAAKAAAKAAAEKKRQQQLESDLQAQLAAEADAQKAAEAGLLDVYIRSIQDKIERNWTRPLSAKPGLDCIVSVVQLPTGDVIEARVTACNGDDAVVRSIEAAVKLASPLPRPPNPNLFERNLNVRFKPEM
jgi:colicin import membrane protein